MTYNGQQITLYEASQEQRSIERHIREWKRRAETTAAAGLDNSRETGFIRKWQAAQRDLINQTGLPRQYVREAI